MCGIVISDKERMEMIEECSIALQYIHKANSSDFEQIIDMFKGFLKEVKEVLGDYE